MISPASSCTQSISRPTRASARTPSAFRACAAPMTLIPDVFDNGISDDTFAKIVACIRIAVPYTGMIVSTRESQASRERVLHLGISQISGGSRTSVGGYTEQERPRTIPRAV